MQDTIRNFLKVIDESIEELSHMQEKNLAGLPFWILSNRKVDIAFAPFIKEYVIKITSDNVLEDDIYSSITLHNQTQLRDFSAVMPGFNAQIAGVFFMLKGMKLEKAEGDGKKVLFKVPEAQFDGLLIFGNKEEINRNLTDETAKRDALDEWNRCTSGFNQKEGSFYEQMNQIFIRFQCLIKRKSFLERRIHRFLNGHADKLLPSHINTYYEHKLFLDGEERTADFILEMEQLQPAWLIELENPTLTLIKKNGEITAEGNHARFQIAEWVKFIEQNPDNTQGKMSFLRGQTKKRLVIMGNSNGDIEALKNNSLYSDTAFWTYNMLVEEAKKRWNKILEEQCKALGINMGQKF